MKTYLTEHHYNGRIVFGAVKADDWQEAQRKANLINAHSVVVGVKT